MNRMHHTFNILEQNMLERILGNDLSVISNKDYFVDEIDDKSILEIPVPGFTKENINIETVDGILIIEGENEESRWAEDFTKRFKIPNSLDPSKVNATIDDGILKIAFEKRKESQSKKIKID